MNAPQVVLDFTEYQQIRRALAQAEGALNLIAGTPKKHLKELRTEACGPIVQELQSAQGSLHDALIRRDSEESSDVGGASSGSGVHQ